MLQIDISLCRAMINVSKRKKVQSINNINRPPPQILKYCKFRYTIIFFEIEKKEHG